MKITLAEIQELCNKVLVSKGLSPEEAEIVTDDYLDAELRGKRSHGLGAFSIAVGGLEDRKKYAVSIDNGSYAYIEGNGDVGHLVGRDAMSMAIEKARAYGVGFVGVGNILRFSIPRPFVEQAAAADMIGIVSEYGGKEFMVPHGGAEPIISTNPLGIGIPSNGTPIIIDMATSERAIGFVSLASKLGQDIPDSWGVDEQGLPTSNPDEVVAVVPFGGYKGYAIALALEVLTGPLVGVKVGTKGNLRERGAVFLAINPELFGVPLDQFKGDVAELVREIKTSKKAPGTKEIFIPGEHSEARKQAIIDQGYLDIEDVIIRDIEKLLEE